MKVVTNHLVGVQAVFAGACFCLGAILTAVGRGVESGAGGVGVQRIGGAAIAAGGAAEAKVNAAGRDGFQRTELLAVQHRQVGELRGLLGWLPAAARPFASLARFDRPIGWWLLFWPGAWGVALAGGAIAHWDLLLWLLLGAIAMRGAGCVYNDIVDRDLDAQVERTLHRPLASGAVSLRAAWIWLVALCLIGLLVLLQLSPLAALVAVLSLALVAAYPFMKRITWWPQAWLGMVFSWAALVGWVDVAGALTLPGILLYLGSIAWVVGYDTIYALQDRDDDAMIGVRSSARAMGSKVRTGVAIFYALAVGLWAAAIWLVRPDPLALAALLPVAAHLGWQVMTLVPDDGDNALARFRSNRGAGLLMAAACLVVGTATAL
jgi:4-hydroxybenzoate polyprenyltransferase